MAALPTLAQIAGNHTTIYEAFYQQVDPAGINHVGALEAAAFLKRSGLADAILSKIWDLSDAGGKGFLDKRGFFVALKLVALVQNGKQPLLANVTLPAPPPNMAEQIRSTNIDWSVKPLEQTKYVEMFNSLGPVAGKLPGTKVKPVMLNSKLPVDVLGKIWDLSDVDQDGALSEEEFIVAMHLVYKALDNCPIPSVLPPVLMPRSKQSPLPTAIPADFSPMGMSGVRRRPSTPSSVGAPDIALHNTLHKPPLPWVVSAAEMAKFSQLFTSLDTDMDGLVSGADVKGTFLKTGLPQADLAQIWNLCDTKQNGSLNAEQFALAMHLAAERTKGVLLPTALTPDMVPPSLRPKLQTSAIGSLDGGGPLVGLEGLTSSTPPPLSAPISGNKELEMITDEMKTLHIDKSTLEQEIIQAETDLKTKSAELRNLETEIETVSAMLKQLDSQKREAQKRLAELGAQKAALDRNLTEVREEIEEERAKVSALKKQLEEQSKLLEEQERDLEQKRAELKGLCQEESSLQAEIDNKKAQLQALSQTQQDTQLQISQVKAKHVALEEQHLQLKTWVSQVERALQAGDPGLVPESLLREDQLSTGLAEPEYQQLSNTDDPFKSKDSFNDMNGFLGDPFGGEDPFKSVDPFNGSVPEDPFAGDPFKSTFGSETKEEDYFAASFQDAPEIPAVADTKDPFDPFGTGKGAFGATNPGPSEVAAAADPFGTDPFAPVQHAARAESPTPALPPKKGKQPPPRPAPPKHLASSRGGSSSASGPTRAAPAPPLPDEDPFASTAGGSATESFANFADFGNC
ncbi:epidermal growth factor receptor substrate 15-like 1 isoform X2 [Dermacentor silvarum]|uniref:epidermal growth factor receptor substrate 15-like 1 isoform X2 n=1 Tax=Dermacentor silvarum TaxID=543639 RepID=UPI001897BC71|nr:epidermal growth factor receptor substrate 15-like 1 isoform X2 [Dermacentor silvarum]